MTVEHESQSDPTPLAPGLYVVATPIGNLEDITLRALRVLRSVDRIASEDTRHTQKLLNHFQIDTRTVSYHMHNEGMRSEELIAALRQGERIAVVSDAGTPGIADPGTLLVDAAIQAGIPVHPVPGPSAVVAAFSAAGLSEADNAEFRFIGFLPAKEGQRRTLLEKLHGETSQGDQPVVIAYDAPHRVIESLAEISSIFGPEQQITVARELTKMHEEFIRGTVDSVRATLVAKNGARGEFVLLFRPSARKESPTARPGIAQEVRQLMETAGLDEREALKRVARVRGISKSEAYRELQRQRR